MKLLVTGSHGYIRTAIIPLLLHGGFEVAGFETDSYTEYTHGQKKFLIS